MQERKIKLYISADMEGVVGVVTNGQLGPQGFEYHTMSSARLADVQLKGVSVSEAGINAAIAGHFNVPVIMVSGDDAVVRESIRFAGKDMIEVSKFLEFILTYELSLEP